MTIISFCLFFNPGATTLIVYIESNSHTYPGNTQWAWNGEVVSKSVAIVLPLIRHRNSSCTLSINPNK